MSNESSANETATSAVEVVEVETTAATSAAAESETVKADHLIYVGPNIASERLNKFALFRGGKPERFNDLFGACPAVEKLFVDVDNLAAVLEKLARTGTAYNTWNAQVQAYLKTKKVK